MHRGFPCTSHFDCFCVIKGFLLTSFQFIRTEKVTSKFIYPKFVP